MTDDTTKTVGDDAEEKAGGSKKSVMLVGGIVGLIGLACATAFMAIPKKADRHVFSGPYVARLLEEEFATNLKDNDHSRFLQMTLNFTYMAYAEDYYASRMADPLYLAEVKDVMNHVCFNKESETIFDPIGASAFMEEIREAVDPVVFPVLIGEGKTAFGVDVDSGLAPGRSFRKGTFRGAFYDHRLAVNAPEQTLMMDGGDPISFGLNDMDVAVFDAEGRVFYVDVTRIEPDFVGELHVGVRGQIRRVLREKLLAQ